MKADINVTQMRRRVVLAVVRREPGLTAGEILKKLEELNDLGQWPVSPVLKAEPYAGAVQNYLVVLAEKRLIAGTHGRGARRWWTVEDLKVEAEKLLPPEDERELLMELARAFTDRSGLELAFGVTDTTLERVVRVRTERGLVDFPVGDSWAEGLQDAIDQILVAA